MLLTVLIHSIKLYKNSIIYIEVVLHIFEAIQFICYLLLLESKK